MSWFRYGDIVSRRRRKGVALKVGQLPSDLLKKMRRQLRPRETIELVQVCEIRPNDVVLLEVSAREMGVDPFNRHTTLTLLAKEDPKWICEGDVGRGWKTGDDKLPVRNRRKAKK